MEKLHFEIVINAPKQKVWETMLNKDTYEQWTSAFNEGSTYRGEWNTGSEMLFVGPNEDGTESGMISRIKESKPYDFVSIQHLGILDKGEKQIWTAEETDGQEFLENYTLNEVDGGTQLVIELDTKAEWKDMFSDMWPKALEKLKEITEK